MTDRRPDDGSGAEVERAEPEGSTPEGSGPGSAPEEAAGPTPEPDESASPAPGSRKPKDSVPQAQGAGPAPEESASGPDEPTAAAASAAREGAARPRYVAPEPVPRYRAPEARARVAWWRRVARVRGVRFGAVALVGVLLGAGLTAWRAGAGPFAGAERSCWGALSAGDVRELADVPDSPHPGRDPVRVDELPVTSATLAARRGPEAACRISGGDLGVDVTLHRVALNGLPGENWARSFLAADMAPFGEGVTGMASDTRAWLALPDACLGRPDGSAGLPVLDLVRGDGRDRSAVHPDDRALLARTAVRLLNTVLEDRGCQGRAPEAAAAKLPEAPRYGGEQADRMCGVEGLRRPRVYASWSDLVRFPAGKQGLADAPVRTCDRGTPSLPDLRMMTVQDSRLAATWFPRRGPAESHVVSRHDGRGLVGDTSARLQVNCPTGTVLFALEAHGSRPTGSLRALFPRYAEQEAQRLGCGPLHIEPMSDG